MMVAMAPSPVTLHAVPNESIAMYVAIMRPTAVSSNPSADCRMPTAAMMAPPGTPGAATMVMPRRKMKPTYCHELMGVPVIVMIANENRTIFMVEPDRWIVAHRGMVNPATRSSTPLRAAHLSVTGMVAAEEDVPSAVAYAGSIDIGDRHREGLNPVLADRVGPSEQAPDVPVLDLEVDARVGQITVQTEES